MRADVLDAIKAEVRSELEREYKDLAQLPNAFAGKASLEEQKADDNPLR